MQIRSECVDSLPVDPHPLERVASHSPGARRMARAVFLDCLCDHP